MGEDRVEYITAEGLEKLKAQLEYLREVKRMEIAERLHRALEEGGDLVENAEYEDAKNEQAFVEGEIRHLENFLSRAQVISTEGPKDIVRMGAHVTVQEKKGDTYLEPETFYLVGVPEVNPSEGKISYKSPLGKALLGHRVGDEVVVDAPAGKLVFVIRKIEYKD